MHLGGKGALGQKTGKTGPKPPKAVRKVSAKRAAYMKSAERKLALIHMAKVAMLPCLVCGAWPVEIHHATKPRSDMHVLPLCPRHHRREFGVGAYHYSPKAFVALHGPISGLLERVAGMLSK